MLGQSQDIFAGEFAGPSIFYESLDLAAPFFEEVGLELFQLLAEVRGSDFDKLFLVLHVIVPDFCVDGGLERSQQVFEGSI